MVSEKNKRIAITLPREKAEYLQDEAEKNYTTVSKMIEKILDKYRADEEMEMPF